MTDSIVTAEDRARGARRTVATTVGIVAFMGGLSFAAVPFYDWFCRVTGFAGTTQVADAASDVVLDQTVLVRFDANTDRDMPWRFEPVEREMRVRIGDNALAFYRAHNPTDQPVAGSASFNVTPFEGGGYFSKIECFCFVEQVLAPGETVEMPVSFYVDPEIVEDAQMAGVKVITLSYTFFRQELPEELASADDAMN